MPVNAGIVMNISADIPRVIMSGTQTQLLVNLTLGTNETGDNLLITDIVYDANVGWNTSSYLILTNCTITPVNISDNDLNVSGILKHRITYITSLSALPSLTGLESLVLKVNLTTPNVRNSTYTIDVISMWSFPASKALVINCTSLNVTVSNGDINRDGKVSLKDAIYLAKHVMGLSGYEKIYAHGDTNYDGKISLKDAIYLAKHDGSEWLRKNLWMIKEVPSIWE